GGHHAGGQGDLEHPGEHRPDGAGPTVGPSGSSTVRITGEPGELLLFAFGRGARAELAVDGPPDAVEALRHVLPLP
ncbi:hypothetical protein ACWC5I_09250, partial [Kitasatospora sp. NPDC001574]